MNEKVQMGKGAKKISQARGSRLLGKDSLNSTYIGTLYCTYIETLYIQFFCKDAIAIN